MEAIEHKTKGEGPLILFLHGFPELWYSWRHQMLHAAASGYRAVAPDLRGYEDTSGPPVGDAAKFTTLHVVGDLTALLDAVAGKEEKEPGDIEAVFAQTDAKTVLRKFLTFRDPSPFYFPKGKACGDLFGAPIILPSWLSEEDLDYYAGKFVHTGLPNQIKETIFTSNHKTTEMEGIEHKMVSVKGVDMHIAEKGTSPVPPRLPLALSQGSGELECCEYAKGPTSSPAQTFRALYGDDHYISRFQILPGEIEAELAPLGTERVVKKFLTFRTPGQLYFPEDKGFGDSPDTPIVLPSWLSQQDVAYFTSIFEKTGFTGGVNYYRALDLSWELTAPWTGAQVRVPTKFIIGDLDLTYHIPGAKEYIHNGGFQKDVPSLEEVVVEVCNDDYGRGSNCEPPAREREREMEGIEHKMVRVNGLDMHVAEKGQGPLVLFLHGFPELWYSWRHQIVYMAAHGYRAVAPDMRGYGDTTGAPLGDITKFTTLHLAGDMVALIDAIAPEEDKVFVVGHDWGALVAWQLCLCRPDRVKALVNLSVMYLPRDPTRLLAQTFRDLYGDDHYISRFQEPGEIEAELAPLGTERVVKKFLTFRTPGPLYFPKGKGFGDSPDTPIILPSWLTEEDVDYFTSKFEKTGFTGGVNYYRALDLSWELTAPWTGATVTVPTKFVVGDLDLTYHITGAQEYIHNGAFHKDVPLLEEVVVMEGVAHFINQEKPDEISKHIHDFLKKF
ncbi:hypothetical protein RJ639_002742 [Escallonia herrerae]|uniref:soluble epoxide hydrolase n=1 Tax=Escallonia herrerae TaxID=1293975 RepID=A0AA89AWH8_9ASTE|nr:hypothetical protein RJ639_002742 [Escallonia herrerae]